MTPPFPPSAAATAFGVFRLSDREATYAGRAAGVIEHASKEWPRRFSSEAIRFLEFRRAPRRVALGRPTGEPGSSGQPGRMVDALDAPSPIIDPRRQLTRRLRARSFGGTGCPVRTAPTPRR